MVQPNVTWYRIPNPTDRRLQCSVVGCIVYGALTDGSRCLCGQHATAIALDHLCLARPVHEVSTHDPQGVCVFCGNQQWYERTGAWVCASCYPPDGTIGSKSQVLDMTAFALVAEPQMMAGLATIRTTPIEPVEQARIDAFSRAYLDWRERATR